MKNLILMVFSITFLFSCATQGEETSPVEEVEVLETTPTDSAILPEAGDVIEVEVEVEVVE
jgi:hypothetical protein